MRLPALPVLSAIEGLRPRGQPLVPASGQDCLDPAGEGAAPHVHTPFHILYHSSVTLIQKPNLPHITSVHHVSVALSHRALGGSLRVGKCAHGIASQPLNGPIQQTPQVIGISHLDSVFT